MGGVRIKSNHGLQIKFAQMSQKTHEISWQDVYQLVKNRDATGLVLL